MVQRIVRPSSEERTRASAVNRDKMWRFAQSFAQKSGCYLHPDLAVTEFLVIGLARHVDQLGRPLCPCNFYENKAEAIRSSKWICPCEEMQKFKYCH